MKFCKDCKHYKPVTEISKFAVGASCVARSTRQEFDPVTGQQLLYAGEPVKLRGKDGECGPDAKWFEPANLDGRLAMLEEK
ncbi:hypothetical protein [Paraburkholderia sp. C35]|uniref:hypothetical protein n=1 Tax=Paraburkholderia sp. C35 TaxID=2126993 RepID=UPI000D69A786|nr:hypothetical protein [Paraburkholderia sp. C35]